MVMWKKLEPVVGDPPCSGPSDPAIFAKGRPLCRVTSASAASEKVVKPQGLLAGRCAHLQSAVNEVKHEVVSVADQLATAEVGLTACMKMLHYFASLEPLADVAPSVGASVRCATLADATQHPASSADPSAAITECASMKEQVPASASVICSASPLPEDRVAGVLALDSGDFANRLEWIQQQLQSVRTQLIPLGTRLQLQDLRLAISIDMLRAVAASGHVGADREAWEAFNALWRERWDFRLAYTG